MTEGQLTFLLTDIEGSTRLWESHPVVMPAINARHDELVGEVVSGHGGEVVRARAEGDSAFVVFVDGRGAAAAALAVQQAMAAEQWPDGVVVRVRMALHAGPVGSRAGEYYGPTVNRCVKLRALAHGGQVVLSEAAAGVVDATLPAGASLRDMGEHRLKDLDRAERVFQLVHPDLDDDFPPLRSVDAEQHNLVVPATTFVTREMEAAALTKLVHAHRLVTVTGPGGVGKTRLVTETALTMLDDFDGVWNAELGSLPAGASVDDVAARVARAAGVRDQPTRPPLDALVDHLRARRVLLVLDNCEHVAGAVAVAAGAVLTSCPAVRMVASSRQPLRVAGEHVWPLPPMEAPPEVAVDVGRLAEFPATRLFLDRAAEAVGDLVLTDADAVTVVELCRHLDGIPLAIEMAAARLAIMDLPAVADGLRRRLEAGFATGDGDDRRATLRATIEWSHDLLTAAEQVLLHRLGVFAGSFTIDAVEGVATGEGVDELDVLDLLDALVGQSLVQTEVRGEVRYRLLQTVREFAAERLGDEVDEVGVRHQAWYLALAERLMPQLYGPSPAGAADVLDAEHADLLAAARFASDESVEDARYRLAVSLYPFWFVRGYWREGRAVLDAVLETPVVRRSWKAYALSSAGALAERLGDTEAALARYAAERDVFQQIEDDMDVWAAGLDDATRDAHRSEYRFRRALASLREANIEATRGRATVAVGRADAGLAEARVAGGAALATALMQAGSVYFAAGALTAARAVYCEALDRLGADAAESPDAAAIEGSLGAIDWMEGEYEAARRRFAGALVVFRRVGDRRGQAGVVHGLADVALALGDPGAEELARESLEISLDLGDEAGTARAREALGAAALTGGDLDRARPLLVASLAARRAAADAMGVASVLLPLGDLHRAEGDPAAALACYDESLRQWSKLLDRAQEARVEVSRAGALLDLGQGESAWKALERAADLLVDRPHPLVASGLLAAAARGLERAGRRDDAAWAAAAGAALRDRIGARVARPWQDGAGRGQAAGAVEPVDVTDVSALVRRAVDLLAPSV